ncbi:Saccharopine dehydrogenase isoform 1 [Theobroma cacao]|uniref:Saccharopine dehydrogenase isoform 1 n=1 Tax=Theobroma cacao TaxID=3641 RepID=A0A061GTE9_THECC|nr:Saccharopine dehydrogenase isoform 1 [Theobroma cacao]
MAPSLLHLKTAAVAVESVKAAEHDNITRVQLPDKTRNSRVLVLGGTGRVGGSTATALSKLCPDLRIVLGGRNRENGAAMVATLGNNSEFAEVNIDNKDSLEAALSDVDLVVHAAGPFQQAQKCNVLEAAIETKTAYLDVCDDTSYAFRAKSFKDIAVEANIPAITTGGIYPGVSNGNIPVRCPQFKCTKLVGALKTLMAAELVRAARSESKGEPERLRFSYYTAGSGGAGPTILATSFLLLGEEVVAYNRGQKIKLKPFTGMLNVDFGKGIGKRDVYLLNLPEVRSAHEVLEVPTVSARFGTAPFFWNWGMEAMTNLLPTEFLRDRSKVQQLVQLFDPLVRAVDGIAGERVSMRVDLECSDGRNTLALFSHRRLSVRHWVLHNSQKCFIGCFELDMMYAEFIYSRLVGSATAAFALAILEGSTQPGVWFPEEPEGIAIEAREVLLERAAQGTISFVMNKPPWMVETDPKELGLGIYV